MLKKLMIIAAIILSLVIVLFMGARYGWRLWGFDACITPTVIYAAEITVDEGSVRLTGDTAASAPAYVGYIYEFTDGSLYLGLKYNALFGFFERNGAFDIKINCNTENLTKIYFKNGGEEKIIWEKK